MARLAQLTVHLAQLTAQLVAALASPCEAPRLTRLALPTASLSLAADSTPDATKGEAQRG